MRHKYLPFIFAIAALFPADAMAQACFGIPMKGQTAAYAALGLPDGATVFQVGGAMALDNPFVVGAEFSHTSADFGGSSNTIAVKGAYKLELDESSPVSVCPLGSAGFTFYDGGNNFSLGLGAGVSTELPLADDAYTLYPYATPMIVHNRFDGFNDTSFGLGIGANFGFSQYFVGGEFNKTFGDFGGSIFRIQAGLNF